MLESIAIKNIGLINEAIVEFSGGLNVLTGETGAGKSMIIDSLGFALGEKTSREIVRSGEKTGKVEAVFNISAEETAARIEEAGIEIEEGLLVIVRSISDTGKTTARINGQAVTTQTLRKITEELIDIHGQYEHQSLLNPRSQMEFVDEYCGEGLRSKKRLLTDEFARYKALKERAAEIEARIKDRESRLEFLDYRISELAAARLKPGEEEALTDEKRIVSASDKLISALNSALDYLYDGAEGVPALDSLSGALGLIENAVSLDKRLEPFVERLYAAQEEIKDVSQELRRHMSGVETDPGRIDEIEERLNEIYIIKRKYGGSVENALDNLEKMIKESEILSASEFEHEKLTKELEQSYSALEGLCSEISGIRKRGAAEMESLITEALKDLSMENAAFSVELAEAEITSRGADRIELFLSANKGETPKPLARIASGGEMSRVMLAIKSIAASQGRIGTFIFDEIDQGTSGRTAQKVAEKLAVLAAEKQIICITHLPQIAAMADAHILIEKQTTDGKTYTKIKSLDEGEITEELSRLLGGAKITDRTIKAAEEMRELAGQIKIKAKICNKK